MPGQHEHDLSRRLAGDVDESVGIAARHADYVSLRSLKALAIHLI